MSQAQRARRKALGRRCRNCGEPLELTRRWCFDCWRMVWKTLGAAFVSALATAGVSWLIARAFQ